MRLPQPLEKIVLRLCEGVNTPRSLTIAILLRNGDFRQLLNLRVLPGHYITAEDYFKDCIVTDFLRKCNIPGVASSDELETECWSRFRATEAACHLTNNRLRAHIEGGIPQCDAPLLSIIDKVRKIVGDICGSIPQSLDCGFGPGATLTNSSRLCTIPDKIEAPLSGTLPAIRIFDRLYGRSSFAVQNVRRHQGRGIIAVRGNRFFTVPKEALKLRGACLSPSINGFLQKGVGKHLRNRLRSVGIDIQESGPDGLFRINSITSADRHRRIARDASRSGAFSTIDLSDASNTIAYQLIKLLFPSGWFELLNDLREPFCEGPDGKFYKLEMFSAMGNGFTFEVETIVFYAICRAIVGDHGYISVFGDDIIIPTEHAAAVLAALQWFGFTPNLSKTFVTGPFRESCGGDFFDGVPVRAHFLKELPHEPQEWIALANGLRRMAWTDDRSNDLWPIIRPVWFLALDNLPSSIRVCRGPSFLGDLVIHDVEESWISRVRHSIRQVRAYSPVQKRLKLHYWKSDVIYLSALYGVPSTGVVPRGAVSGYKMKWIPCS